MSEPDELYTLRALYWLGHYNLCLEEAKSVSRRPMAAHLKVEREQFVLRALLALKQYDKVLHDSTGEDKDAGSFVGSSYTNYITFM
jgi:coatomer protein complex subunit epsilon